MSVIALNVIALASGFLGTVLVFFFGLPPGIVNEGAYVAHEPDNGQPRRLWLYRIASYVGLALISLGFLLQLFAIWC